MLGKLSMLDQGVVILIVSYSNSNTPWLDELSVIRQVGLLT